MMEGVGNKDRVGEGDRDDGDAAEDDGVGAAPDNDFSRPCHNI